MVMRYMWYMQYGPWQIFRFKQNKERTKKLNRFQDFKISKIIFVRHGGNVAAGVVHSAAVNSRVNLLEENQVGNLEGVCGIKRRRERGSAE